MYKELLSEEFFEKNQCNEISAQKLTCTVLLAEGMEENISNYVKRTIDPARLEAIAQEKKMLEALEEPEKIVNYLRKNIDVVNRPVLVKKALEYEADIMPAVLKMLLTSDNDRFIENAIRLLAKSEADYTAQLYEMYNNIRSTYVKSLVCIVLGIRGEESLIPWMYEEYKEMKKRYWDSEENYPDGPLLALYELRKRFYGRLKSQE